jgi:hypothetical protein
MMRAACTALCALAVLFGCDDSAEQVADRNVDLSVADPAFDSATSPIVYIDAGHDNFHTAEGRYAPFAALLQNDGARVEGGEAPFDAALLSRIDILVIANADYSGAGQAPFTQEEVAAVVSYVEQGGSLLLVADHIPYAGAAAPLAVRFEDVFAEDDGSGLFTRANGGLADDPLLSGITQIRTFAGSAFTVERPGVRPLLLLNNDWTIQRMGATGLSEKEDAAGLLQGAIFEAGAGRVAVFGEAGMFTAQIGRDGPLPLRTGFGARGAEQNKVFVLNVVRWLAGAD